MKKTPTPKKGEITRKWYLIDARNKTLGRLASQIAKILNLEETIIFERISNKNVLFCFI